MVELKDIVDEVIPLEEVFFPMDKSRCGHVALDDTFIPVKDGDRLIGCIMKCANCGHLEEYECTCSVGAIEEDPDTGQIYTMHACNLQENQKFLKGLKKYWDWAEYIPFI